MSTLTLQGNADDGFEIVGRDIPAKPGWAGGEKTWGGYEVFKRALRDAMHLAEEHGAELHIEVG